MTPSRLAGLRPTTLVALALVALGICGCAASRATRTPSARGEPPELSYVIRLTNDEPRRIEIELTLESAHSSPVLTCDNEWGGIESCEKEIGLLQAFDAERRPVSVEQHENVWTLAAKPGAMTTVRYRLAPTRSDRMDQDDRYYPMVGDRYSHFVGHVALLAPKEEPGRESPVRDIQVHWRGFDEAGWNTACSFGTDRDISVRRSLVDFLHSVFVAGDYQISRRSGVDGEVILAIRPNTWKFGADDLLTTAMPVIDEERRLFRERASTLLLTATPMALDADAIHGTMLTNSVALFFPRPGRVVPAPFFGLLLAHELFHNWDAIAMRPSESEGAGVMWFTEGFAEFYMRRVAYRAGRISKNDYLWHLNSGLRAFSKSPVRDVSNETLRTDFWKTPEMTRLPYDRGQIVALITDAEIRKRSAGARSLDDLMRSLLAGVRSSGQGVTTESVLARIGAFTSAEFESEVRRIVVDGGQPTIGPETLAPCFRLSAVIEDTGDGASKKSVTLPQFEANRPPPASCGPAL